MASDGGFDELNALIRRALSLYDDLVAIGANDVERRRDVWSEIVEVQDRITVILPPATNPL